MISECNFSFNDLYEAAFGKSLDVKEKAKFQELSQQEINILVLQWAKKAGWKTTKKINKDKTVFIAFNP